MSSYVSSDPGVEIAMRLRMACEAHESELGTHLTHVARYACELGRHIGLSEDVIRDIQFAAPLHDVGKIAIPLGLLRHPGSLTAEEMELMKRHTEIGHRILEGSPWSIVRCAARIALSHHENWDGSGYPHGLSGEQIPIEARLCAIADVYDALKTQRCYKPAWPEPEVISELRELSGTKFEPRLVEAFLEILPRIHVSAA